MHRYLPTWCFKRFVKFLVSTSFFFVNTQIAIYLAFPFICNCIVTKLMWVDNKELLSISLWFRVHINEIYINDLETRKTWKFCLSISIYSWKYANNLSSIMNSMPCLRSERRRSKDHLCISFVPNRKSHGLINPYKWRQIYREHCIYEHTGTVRKSYTHDACG